MEPCFWIIAYFNYKFITEIRISTSPAFADYIHTLVVLVAHMDIKTYACRCWHLGF